MSESIESLRNLFGPQAGALREGVRRRLLREGENPEDAADGAQRAVAVAWAKLRNFRGRTPEELRAWIEAIAVNHHRNGGRRRLPGGRAVSLDGAAGTLISADPQPPEDLERRESAERLESLLDCLLDGEREAILRHHRDGLSVPQVARLLGRSESAVGGLLKRGTAKLRQRAR